MTTLVGCEGVDTGVAFVTGGEPTTAAVQKKGGSLVNLK